MAAISVSALVSLAVVLLVSGTAKLLAPETGRTLLSTVPLPSALRAGWVQGVLPWVEIVLAAGLLFTSGTLLIAAALAATVLFAAFTAVVLRGTRVPDPASCGCFGSLSRAPVSRRTVVRNLGFTLVAVLALVLAVLGADGPAVDVPWWTVAAGALPVVLVLLTVWSERPGAPAADPHDVARVPLLPDSGGRRGAGGGREAAAVPATGRPAAVPARMAPDAPDGAPDPAPGAEPAEYERVPIPFAGLTGAEGSVVTLRELARTQARALFTVSPTCGSCAPVIERLTPLRDRVGPVALHAVVAREEHRDLLPAPLRPAALVDREHATATLFEQSGTPWAVVLGADGLLAGGPVAGSGPVLELLDELQERFAA
ncbi:MauE/DoxX family redox-associated membrane protein [Kocuria tytonis]|uniref:Methylamine utilisation protein MauE domain-containing protein n=1 Tax=Kocuria tytonis TaxID=2054280 RepID=A0A495A3V6_9MICC|nr:MauE/DoxX family redox-associated membrane protein [Kocuria tytonis]RKQ34228.1 hypothetical protein C1C97_010155 [Kocuria tytonis]